MKEYTEIIMMKPIEDDSDFMVFCVCVAAVFISTLVFIVVRQSEHECPEYVCPTPNIEQQELEPSGKLEWSSPRVR